MSYVLGLSQGQNLQFLNSYQIFFSAYRFFLQVQTLCSLQSCQLRLHLQLTSIGDASPERIWRQPSTTDLITLKNASSYCSFSLRNLPLNSMNLKKMLFINAQVCSEGFSKSKRVIRVSQMSPVGTQSSPKLISFSSRQAFKTGCRVLQTPSRLSWSSPHSSIVQQPFSSWF